jgi:hypothetical protein
MRTPQNTPPFMAGMNAARGKGDAIPLIAFHNAPLLEAGFFTPSALSLSDTLLLSNPE